MITLTNIETRVSAFLSPFSSLLSPLFIALLLTSCSDFLKESPKGSLYEDEAYNTLDKLENNALLNIYNYIGGNADSQGLQGTGKGVYDLNSVTTDEQIVPTRGGDWYDGGLWQRLFLHTWTAGEGPLKDTWDYLYKVVMLCNEGIERFEAFHSRYDEGDTEWYRIKEDIAELRALRAMYYFYIMDLYGRVPLVTRTGVKSSELTLSPRRDTYLFIVKELQESANWLSVYSSTLKGRAYYGRMTYGVANFLLAKLMINGEIYYDNNWTDGVRTPGSEIFFDIDGERMNIWQATRYYCNLLDQDFDLTEDYADNFIVNNETSVENIFTIPMDPLVFSNVYNYFFRSRHYSHGAVLGGASENGPCATISTMKAYGYGTDNPDFRMDFNFYYDEVEENGKQVYEDDGVTPLIYYPLDVTDIDLTGFPHEKTAGARLGKYAYDETARDDGRMGNNDIVLFRFADILLIEAEAILRDGGPVEDAADRLNRVRRRSNMSEIQQPTLDDILRERLIELMWEGWRRNDLIRYDLFHKAYDIRPQAAGEADCHTIVFPIPADVMAMHPDWQQNYKY